MRETAFTIRIALAAMVLTVLWSESAQAEFRSRMRFKSRGKPYPSASRRNRGTISSRFRSSPSFGGTGRVVPGSRTHTFSGNSSFVGVPNFPVNNAPTFLAPRPVVQAPSGPQTFANPGEFRTPATGKVQCYSNGRVLPSPLLTHIEQKAANTKKQIRKEESFGRSPAHEMIQSDNGAIWTIDIRGCSDHDSLDTATRVHAITATYQDLVTDDLKECMTPDGRRFNKEFRSLMLAQAASPASTSTAVKDMAFPLVPSSFAKWKCFHQAVDPKDPKGDGNRSYLERRLNNQYQELLSLRRLAEAFTTVTKSKNGLLDADGAERLAMTKDALIGPHQKLVDKMLEAATGGATTLAAYLELPPQIVAFQKSGFLDVKTLQYDPDDDEVMSAWASEAGFLTGKDYP